MTELDMALLEEWKKEILASFDAEKRLVKKLQRKVDGQQIRLRLMQKQIEAISQMLEKP